MAQNTLSLSAAVVVAIAAAILAAAPSSLGSNWIPVLGPVGMPDCVESCGDVLVPYPFGIGPDASCYLPGFNLTCDDTSRSGEARLLPDAEGTLQVHYISGEHLYLEAQHKGDVEIDGNGSGSFGSRDGRYRLSGSSEHFNNELILTGCNVQATVTNSNGVTVASCTSLCGSSSDDDDQHDDNSSDLTVQCSGVSTGCCRGDIVTPDHDEHHDGGYDVQLRWLGLNRSADLERFPVRMFVAKHGWFDNSSVYIDLLQTRWPPSEETMRVPVYLKWEIVSTSFCKSNHSARIINLPKGKGGHVCACKEGYYGNPYVTGGCQDINECEFDQNFIHCYGECINTEGSPGTTGNHSIHDGCIKDTTLTDKGTCRTSCGDVEVLYPFGIGPSKCYWPGFSLTCNTSHDPPLRVTSISLPNTMVRVIRHGVESAYLNVGKFGDPIPVLVTTGMARYAEGLLYADGQKSGPSAYGSA